MSRFDEMKNYIPGYLQQSNVFLSVLGSEGQEFGDLRTNIEDVLKQFYVETATDWGLDLWEQMLGLSSYAGKPLDQRRSRIISKIRGMGTVNTALIQNVAESYVYGHVTVTENPETYSFTIKFVDPYGLPPNLADVQTAIEAIKPAHLAVIYEFTFTTYEEISSWGLTYGDLAALTYDDIRVYRPE